MRPRSRAITSALGLAAILGLSSLPTEAQEPKAGSHELKGVTAKKAADPSRRVPDYFGQIGLTPEQRGTIYKIRSKHTERIEALQKQIDQIQDEMLSECEGQLTESQKKLLEHRRNSQAKGKKTPQRGPDAEKTATGKGA